MKFTTATLLAAATTFTLGCSATGLPVVTVDRDNVEITESCEVRIPAGTVIQDADGNGVIHIAADGVTVVFAEGSALRGNTPDTLPNAYAGLGIRIDGHTDVTLENAHVHGYRVGVYATATDNLTIDGGDYSDQYHPKLTSTAEREGGGDWLSPHNNDNNEWLNNYAAAIYIEDATGVTARNITIRKGQHGLLFDRVDDSFVYDNDISFISGWGFAMWRSSNNMVSRNAFDFCIRGHSEGVYNRGQDSSGIVLFEQCNDNLFIENSATHGGDGIFGFAGLESLGLPDRHEEGRDYERLGCNDNLFIGNDLSYASAHGLEMTFGFGNIIIDNRFVENAICGVWGGFSQETLIMRNEFRGNGGMAYGLERGGVNIEHSIDNVIVNNDFINNRAGIALWFDDPGQIATLPWGQANYGELDGNVIAQNRFVIDDTPQPFFFLGEGEKRIGVLLRDDSSAGRLAPVAMVGNTFEVDPAVGEEVALWNETQTVAGEMPEMPEIDVPEAMGSSSPVGARAHLRGRENIIMGEWGPWDHESVLIRPVSVSASARVFQVFGLDGTLNAEVEGSGVTVTVEDDDVLPGTKRVTVRGASGVHAYDLTLTSGDWTYESSGTLLNVEWQGVTFNYPMEDDPRENEQAWIAHAKGDSAVHFTTDAISYPFGGGGMSDQGISDEVTAARLAPDHFGVLAKAEVPLTAGTWRITTLTDDGIRIAVDGDLLIDNWTWHAPETDTATFTLSRDQSVTLELAYFELNGGATLDFKLEPVED
ncbi:MAG: right-handed parallel beta-helix repeat-containing protein [Phycisphaerales bacterium JB063]